MSRSGDKSVTAAGSYPRWVVSLAALVCRIFFRRVEVVGRELVPRTGPVLFVANHVNGLVDPLLVVGFLPGRPRFLAKSTLWENPFLRPFLRLGGVIPVYRRRDPGFDAAKNDETFAACRRVLADGGSIALFPEGQSHNEPALTPIKTGAARILLGGEEALMGTRIVPVGLHFDRKSRFRSRALVRVGPPLEIPRERDEVADEGEATARVRRLTERIAAGLASVTLNFETWEEARLLSRATGILLRDRSALPGGGTFGERFDRLEAVQRTYRRLRSEAPESVASLRRSIAAYDELLTAFRVRDDQVSATYELPSVVGYLLRSGLLLLLWLPVSLLGLLLNVVPYLLCGRLASRFAREPDQPASFKLFGGLILYPLFWGLETWLAYRWGGGRLALGILVLAVLGGWASLSFVDRVRQLIAEARAFVVLRTRRASVQGPALIEELRRRRDDVRSRLLALADT